MGESRVTRAALVALLSGVSATTVLLLGGAVVAQLADFASWTLMPRWAEANVLIRDMHTDAALFAKAALVVVVLALQPALRPKYAAVGDLVAVVAIVVGCLGAGSNLSVLAGS